MTHGEPSSAPTPSPTESTSRQSTAWASRPATFAATKPPARVWNSGAARSSPIPSGRSWRRLRTTKKHPAGRGRSAPHRGCAPQLAVLARPPHRRLRAHHPAVSGVSLGKIAKPSLDRHPPRSAIACPPSGSRTKPRGSPGRTIARTGRASSPPFPGSTPRSCAILRGSSASTSWSNDEAAEAKARASIGYRRGPAEKLQRAPARAAGISSSGTSPPIASGLRDSGPIFVRRDAREQSQPAAIGRDGVAVQCLGEVQRLEDGRSDLRRVRPALASPDLATRGRSRWRSRDASYSRAAAST